MWNDRFDISLENFSGHTCLGLVDVLLPLIPEIACRAIELSDIYCDPFDRLIITMAMFHDARLASIDSLFPQYPELQGYLMT